MHIDDDFLEIFRVLYSLIIGYLLLFHLLSVYGLTAVIPQSTDSILISFLSVGSTITRFNFLS